jgi:hypothetical protein
LTEAEGLGFERDEMIFEMSANNLASLGLPIRLALGDYRSLLDQYRFPRERRIVAFLAPPWADALSAKDGLDLARTKPPIVEIVDDFEAVYSNSSILYAVEVHERLVPEPLTQLREQFDWSEVNIYDVAGATGRHGLLLGGKRWP